MMSAFPSSLDTDKLFLVEGQAVVVDEEAEGVRYARHRETTNIVINATTALPSSCRKNDRPGFFSDARGTLRRLDSVADVQGPTNWLIIRVKTLKTLGDKWRERNILFLSDCYPYVP